MASWKDARPTEVGVIKTHVGQDAPRQAQANGATQQRVIHKAMNMCLALKIQIATNAGLALDLVHGVGNDRYRDDQTIRE